MDGWMDGWMDTRVVSLPSLYLLHIHEGAMYLCLLLPIQLVVAS